MYALHFLLEKRDSRSCNPGVFARENASSSGIAAYRLGLQTSVAQRSHTSFLWELRGLDVPRIAERRLFWDPGGASLASTPAALLTGEKG